MTLNYQIPEADFGKTWHLNTGILKTSENGNFMKFSYRLQVLFIVGIFWPEGMVGTATFRSKPSPNESIKAPTWSKMATIDSLNISDTWRHFLAAINCTSERCPENWGPDHRVTSRNPEPWNRTGVANVSRSRIFKDTFRLSGKNRYNFAHK